MTFKRKYVHCIMCICILVNKSIVFWSIWKDTIPEWALKLSEKCKKFTRNLLLIKLKNKKLLDAFASSWNRKYYGKLQNFRTSWTHFSLLLNRFCQAIYWIAHVRLWNHWTIKSVCILCTFARIQVREQVYEHELFAHTHEHAHRTDLWCNEGCKWKYIHLEKFIISTFVTIVEKTEKEKTAYWSP